METNVLRRGAEAHSVSGNIEELAAVLEKAVQRLSPHAVATLVAHPDAVTSALAVAADSLSAQDAAEADVEVIRGEQTLLADAETAAQRIAGRTRRGPEEELLTSDELASRAALKTRQSVHDWRRKGRIIGWQGAKRGYVFPAGQLDQRGQPLQGLDRIAVHFADGYAAWAWLTTPRASLDGATPLARLRQGEIDRVAAAAQGDAQGDFA